MSAIQLSLTDWVVLGGYLAAVLGIGAYAATRVRHSGEYFLGNRGFGKLVMIAQSFGTGTHAEMPVSLAGAVYSIGAPGIWFQWKSLFATPFYWLIAPLFRRFRRTTMSEVVSDRYGAAMGVFYTLFSLAFFTINLGSMLKGAGKVIHEATGGGLSVNAITAGMTAIFIVYSFVGGLIATAWSDVFQGLLIIVLSFAIIPRGWQDVGGIAGMKATLGAAKFSLVAPAGLGPWFILILTVNGMVGILAQPHLIAAVGTGRNERTCRIGQFYGNLIKRICTVGWTLIGLITAALVARNVFGTGQLADPEDAFGFACRHLLFPGGIGLLIASFLAANMAGCSAFMIDSGAIVTHGLYRKYIAPQASDRSQLWVGRVSGLAVTLAAVGYGIFLVQRVLYSFLLTETLAAFVGISILGGIVWPRANRWGAAASIAAALTANFAGYALIHQRMDYWDPNVFCGALVSGIAALVVVSLLTPAEKPQQTAAFFQRLRTPSDDDAPGAHTSAAATGQELLVVNLLSLEAGADRRGLWRAYREDWKGLILGSSLVLGLVALVWCVFKFA